MNDVFHIEDLVGENVMVVFSPNFPNYQDDQQIESFRVESQLIWEDDVAPKLQDGGKGRPRGRIRAMHPSQCE